MLVQKKSGSLLNAPRIFHECLFHIHFQTSVVVVFKYFDFIFTLHVNQLRIIFDINRSVNFFFNSST